MKTRNFVFLFISVGFYFASGQKDSSEIENPANTPAETMTNEKQNKSMEKTNFHTRQRLPEYLITQDPNLLIEPRLYYAQFVDEGSTIPQLGFLTTGRQRQNIYLSDRTGQYDIKLQNFQQGKPSDFQTALGAISAHILNQRNNQEYIPYPPNGDPHNYPAYRGHPRATEPPVVRAYERASNSNYDPQPADFDQQNPRRLFNPINYHQPDFQNQFPNSGFYNSPEFFNGGEFYSEFRRNSDPVFESRWYDQGEGHRRPIK